MSDRESYTPEPAEPAVCPHPRNRWLRDRSVFERDGHMVYRTTISCGVCRAKRLDVEDVD